jgi:hypothetical protein
MKPEMPDSKSIQIFHHMPKCGGTAMRNALGRWFQLVMDYISVDELQGRVPMHPPVALTTLRCDQCLCGHFETPLNHVFTRYPDLMRPDSRFRLFSLVRDPLALRISLYYFEAKKGRRDPAKQSLSDNLKSGRNYLARRFACTEDDYIEVLDRYEFIGLQERLQDSLDHLGRMFDKPPVRLPRGPESGRDDQILSLSDADRERFKEENQLDYLIYEHVKARFEREVVAN